jgi:hypothetical protein
MTPGGNIMAMDEIVLYIVIVIEAGLIFWIWVRHGSKKPAAKMQKKTMPKSPIIIDPTQDGQSVNDYPTLGF